MALGGYPEVSLAEAREAHMAARKLLATGVDPVADRRQQANQLKTTFQDIAEQWWKSCTERHADSTIRRLKMNVFPAIGARAIEEIQAPELVKMLKCLEEERGVNDLARRMPQHCGQIFRYSIAHGHATRNPASEIRPGDILAGHKTVNYARLDAKVLPGLLRHIEVFQGSSDTLLAMRLMAMASAKVMPFPMTKST